MLQILLDFVATLDRSMKQMHSRAGSASLLQSLTLSQLQYLEKVGVLGESTISQISSEMGVTKASASQAVSRLVQMGLLSKERSEGDGRVSHIRLTAQGEAFYRLKFETLQQYERFIRRALTPQEQEALEELLRKLISQFP